MAPRSSIPTYPDHAGLLGDAELASWSQQPPKPAAAPQAAAAQAAVVASQSPAALAARLTPAAIPTIYLTRHGQSMYNLTDQIGGDPELSALGKRYAAALGALLLSLYPPEHQDSAAPFVAVTQQEQEQATAAADAPKAAWGVDQIERAKKFIQEAFDDVGGESTTPAPTPPPTTQQPQLKKKDAAHTPSSSPEFPMQQPLAAARSNSFGPADHLIEFSLCKDHSNPAADPTAEQLDSLEARKSRASAARVPFTPSSGSSASSISSVKKVAGDRQSLQEGTLQDSNSNSSSGLISPPVSSDEEEADLEDDNNVDDEKDGAKQQQAKSHEKAAAKNSRMLDASSPALDGAWVSSPTADHLALMQHHQHTASHCRRAPATSHKPLRPAPFVRHHSDGADSEIVDTTDVSSSLSSSSSSSSSSASATKGKEIVNLSAAASFRGPGTSALLLQGGVHKSTSAVPSAAMVAGRLQWSPSAPSLMDSDEAAAIAHSNHARMNHLAASVHIPESSLVQLFKGSSFDREHRRCSTPCGALSLLPHRPSLKNPAEVQSDHSSHPRSPSPMPSSFSPSCFSTPQKRHITPTAHTPAAEDENENESCTSSSYFLSTPPASFPRTDSTPRLMIHTSSLKRTISTSAHMLHAFPATHSSILDEIESGDFDHLTYEQIKREHPKEADARKKDKLGYRYPSGESYEDLLLRVAPVVDAVIADKPILSDRHVLLISHQATLRCVYGALRGVAKHLVPELDIPLHTLIRIRFVDGNWEETRFHWNDVSDSFEASSPTCWPDTSSARISSSTNNAQSEAR